MNREEFSKLIFKDIDGLINIREIDKEEKGKKPVIKQSFLTMDQLQKYDAPQDKNIYYGVYTRNGREGKAIGCKTTGALWADYDGGITLLQAKSNIEAAGLPEPSIFVNSGHGIHVYWLLDKRTKIKANRILKAIAINTGADTKAAEVARVMRLPETNNVKEEPVVRCEVIESNSNIYSIKIFENILKIQEETENEIAAVSYKIDIPELLNSDRACIRAMANGVKEGHRNFTEGRLIKYLQVKGITKDKTKTIILKWNNNNNPPEEVGKLLQDFQAYWKGDYKLLGCSIKNPELQSVLYDYCDRSQCRLGATIGGLKLDNSIKYNNRLFNCISKLTGNNLIVLGVLTRHKEGLTIKLLTEKITCRATSKSCMSRMTIIETLKLLKSIGLIESIEGNKRAGKENLYKILPQGTYGTGYTICSNGAINGAIDGRVTAAEFKLYVLLLKYAYQKGSCYPSQITLSNELRITQPAVSLILTSLEKVDYIKKNINYLNGAESLIYTLLV